MSETHSHVFKLNHHGTTVAQAIQTLPAQATASGPLSYDLEVTMRGAKADFPAYLRRLAKLMEATND